MGGNNRFREDTVYSVAKNPIYCGYVRYQEEIRKGKHNGIISKKLFDEVNKKIAKETKKIFYNADEHVHLLKGLIRCMDCGSLMTPFPSGKKDSHGKPYLYYTCTNVVHDKSHSKCSIRSFSARAFENTIKQFLSDLGENKDVLISCISAANEQAQKSLKPLYGKKELLQNEENKLTLKIKKILDIMLSQDMVSDEIKDEYKKLVNEKKFIKCEIGKINIEIDFKRRGVLDVDIVQKSLKTFKDIIDKMSLEDQKDLMQSLIKEIRVFPVDTEKEKSPKGLGTFKAKIRNKLIKAEVDIYELSIPPASYNKKNQKFVFCNNWLPRPDSNQRHGG